MAKKLNDEMFDEICMTYGLVKPMKTTAKCYWTVPACASKSYQSFARKEAHADGVKYVVCKDLWHDGGWGASMTITVRTEKELHVALTNMMKEYHELIKNERKRKIEEL